MASKCDAWDECFAYKCIIVLVHSRTNAVYPKRIKNKNNTLQIFGRVARRDEKDLDRFIESGIVIEEKGAVNDKIDVSNPAVYKRIIFEILWKSRRSSEIGKIMILSNGETTDDGRRERVSGRGGERERERGGCSVTLR